MPGTTTLYGIVIPAAWNESGEIVSLSIVTYDEKKYRVKDTRQGWKLLSSLRKRVVVQGLLSRQGAVPVIEVETFHEDLSKI